MTKRVALYLWGIVIAILSICPVYAADMPQVDTPNYKVAFYQSNCYHMQDEDGKKTGYGYEMMQGISKYMQCTFSYVGYDKSPQECEEMLRNGELDIYTAAKITPERQKEFAISKHPAITSTTSMNVKAGNTKVVAGDYSTYNGLRIGLLARHTYNNAFIAFTKEKGFDCEIVYYETPTELNNALIHDEVDALVNSYIRTPEDEQVIENFGQTPYYIMARKEDQSLIDQMDAAIDSMNVDTPNWRVELYNKYYGSQNLNTELTDDEKALLAQMQADKVVVRGVMNPDGNPYSWYEDGAAHGIVADIFKATAKKLGLKYEITVVKDKDAYQKVLDSGSVDVWMDLNSYYENENAYQYKITDPYLTTTVSVLRQRGSSSKMKKIAVIGENVSINEIISKTWPDAKTVKLDSTTQCTHEIVNGNVDGALLMSYTAQKVARDDSQNRLSAEIVPGATLDLQMGINARDNYHFYGIWEKTLAEVSDQMSEEVIQSYLEEETNQSLLAYLFDHPAYLLVMSGSILVAIFFIILYLQSVNSKNKQQKITDELVAALKETKQANEAKQNFFSKMSHDIRTPLNVVLGMTQIAQKYKHDINRLDSALNSITTEGNYLLSLVNSILDVNQLEYGHVELVREPFDIVESTRDSVEILRPLADNKEQHLSVTFDRDHKVVVGDANRFRQIMINIISNAIKYTNGGGTIDVHLECLENNRCRFTCSDNGIGMSQEFIEHIFEDYVRAEDSRISKIEGTGLGMSVVKGFTDLMHGTLHIESEPGKGSTFTVEIPFEEASKEQCQTVLNPVRGEESHEKFSGKRVLLVEDNALNAEIATELLQSIGLIVDWAENGKEGVERFEASKVNTYFAVFMDMQMPVMDGIEATKLIRGSDREDSDIPVFAMTANTFASDRKRCQEAGMTGYIPKPVNIKDIEGTLAENTIGKNKQNS